MKRILSLITSISIALLVFGQNASPRFISGGGFSGATGANDAPSAATPGDLNITNGLNVANGPSRKLDEAPKSTKKEQVIEPSYAWTLEGPLGNSIAADIDTSHVNYSLRYVPAIASPAYATTGTYGGEGQTMIYFDRKPTSDFLFRDALDTWLPSTDEVKFYNTRIPMTLLSYNFGGGKEASQDRLKAEFSGNINKRAQVGALVDYIYSKGSFNYQAAKNFMWGLSGSYLGERYEFQGFYRRYNATNKENGGIVDDRYITDPAEIQGGTTKVDYKTVPTFLSATHNSLVGQELYLNNRYKIGFNREVESGDSTIQEFVPVTSFIWALKFQSGDHRFINTNKQEDNEFWQNSYLSTDGTDETTTYWQLRNTLGISLLEGFNKYAKAGLSVFLTHEYRHFRLPVDTRPDDAPTFDPNQGSTDSGTIDGTTPPIDSNPAASGLLTPLPFSVVPTGAGQNLMWVGAQIARRQGKILNYEATGEIGFIGEAAGEVKLHGNVATNIPLFGDTVSVVGYGEFTNLSAPYLLKHYISNHFAWDNDFGKTRRLRFGGELRIPQSGTSIHVGAENVQNLIYFNHLALPTQCSSSVQVFTARLRQNFHFKAWHWDNDIIYQTSSNQDVIPMPKLAIYSNMYVMFKIAKVFHVQLGVDCNFYTKYKAVDYQPATMSFYNQREFEVGNYPLLNAYVNMKLSKCHFYVMFTHVNQGLFGGNNWFSMPHYPINPRRLQLGVSVDFAN